jgi:hypothetical protein
MQTSRRVPTLSLLLPLGAAAAALATTADALAAPAASGYCSDNSKNQLELQLSLGASVPDIGSSSNFGRHGVLWDQSGS